MYNDVMTTPDARNLNFVSKITLAAMKDTGWYTVIEDAGQLIMWGRNGGCSFLGNHCDGTAHEFCDDSM